jgi:hypothetical protein
LGELDQPVTFNFAEGDPINTSWKYVDSYSFNLNESRLAVIEVNSQDFDTYLYLFDDLGNILGIHDDSSPVFTTDSQITSFLGPGIYEVLITSFDEAETGEYKLSIDLFRPE